MTPTTSGRLSRTDADALMDAARGWAEAASDLSRENWKSGDQWSIDGYRAAQQAHDVAQGQFYAVVARLQGN